jgi:hypothetical protein
MNATGGRGVSRSSSTGSIFTVGKPDDPDFGGGRAGVLVHEPAADLLADARERRPRSHAAVLCAMYLDYAAHAEASHANVLQARRAHFPETITFWGAEVSAHYGWTPFEARARPEAECSYVYVLLERAGWS